MFDITAYAGALELAKGVPALHPERRGRLNISPLKNWVEKNGGLPTYINSVATALLREHPEWGISRVIATAVNWAKKVCATGRAFGGRVAVGKLVKAAACAAVASWNRKKKSASNEQVDNAIIEASESGSVESAKATMRKAYRANDTKIPEAIMLSDDEYFTHVVGETIQLSDDGEEDYVDDIDAFMHVMELSAASQNAVRLPLNVSEAKSVGGNKYKKEILRVGEIVVDKAGRKFNFTPDFLKRMKNNFHRAPIDYVPLLFTEKGEIHASDGKPQNYGGVIEDLELDDENNPTKLIGTFNLTDETAKLVEHNKRYGVSVTAHPNYVDGPRGQYYGPVLLDVAGTHKPKLTRMGDWSRVEVMASDEQERYEVIDLSDSIFVDNIEEVTEQEDTDMADENKTLELSDEQRQELFSEFMNSEAFTTALNNATSAKDEEITRLSNQLGEMEVNSYKNTVKGAINTYRNRNGAGVPPVMLDMAEELMLSFNTDERNAKIELSMGEGENATTQTLNRVQLITKMLDEAQNFVNLSSETGSSEEPVELSDKQQDDAAEFLADLTRNLD